MVSSENSEIELESFIPNDPVESEQNDGPPYDAKSKSGRKKSSGRRSLQRVYYWICHSGFSYKFVVFVILFFILFFIGNSAKNSTAIYTTKKLSKGASIQSDYSAVRSVDDLKAIASGVDDFCFVSTVNEHGIFTAKPFI
jgi:hypothetical protein